MSIFNNSGIEGQVILGPLTPVQRPGKTNSRAFQATITVLNKKGEIITKFQSGEDGHFRVSLKPGVYVLHPESPRSLPRAPVQTITVSENKFTQVDIKYDTGIR